jgi:hypothetical protein
VWYADDISDERTNGMSTTLQEQLTTFLTEQGFGNPDADAWSKIEVHEIDGEVVMTWKDWARGETGDGTNHRVKLPMTMLDFMEKIWSL